jgi:tetratricopeptide (TPR) repeat protein
MSWWFFALTLLTIPTVAGHLEQAVDALEREDWPTAVTWLEKIATEEPENVEVQFNLAYCYSKLGQNEKAVRHYRKVVTLKPGLPAAHMNLGVALMEQGVASEALPHFKTAREIWPEKFPPALFYAHSLLEIEPSSAVDAYKYALRLNSQSADAHLGLGQALLRAGNSEEAPSHYRRAIEINPELNSMQLELAEHFEHTGSPQKALSLYKDHLVVNPTSIVIRQKVGFLLLHLKQYHEAVTFFEKSVEREPTAANHAALAEAYLNTDKLTQALTHMREATAYDDADPELRLHYANLLLHDKQFSVAARNYLALLKRTPSDVVAWNGLAFAMYKNGDLAGALNAIIQSTKVGPSKPAQVYLRAIIEDNLDLHKEALVSYRRFLELDSGLENEKWKAGQRAIAIEKILKRR